MEWAHISFLPLIIIMCLGTNIIFFFFFFLLDWSISSVRYREGSQLGLEKEVSQINSSYSKLTLHWFSAVKNLPAKQETQVHFLAWEDPLEKEMATQSNSLAWEIPWIEEPGRLQFVGSQRVRARLND